MKTVIIEGPDCGGKTTLIRSAFENYQVTHNGVFKTSARAMSTYIQQLNSIHCDSVFDRMHLSELIYGKIMRDTIPNRELFASVEMLAAYRETVIVVCLPPLDAVLEQWRARQRIEYVKKEAKIIEVYASYKMLATLSTLPVVFYDYTEGSLCKELMAEINNKREEFYGN
jgi:hypothetical protein